MTMKLHLTEAQLLHEWQLRAFPEPVNSGCVITRDDGVDLDALLRARMLDWYRRLLHEAPFDMLAPVTLTLSLTVDRDGVGRAALPDSVVRVAEVAVGGCRAELVTDSRSRKARLQQSPYTRAAASNPVAVLDGRRIDIFVVSRDCREVVLQAVVDDGVTFSLDAAALGAVESFINA